MGTVGNRRVMNPKTLRVGTRGSELALWQAHWVQQTLAGHFRQLECSVHVIKTRGDITLDSPLARIGDKALFTREIELALVAGDVDIAVHSLKDLPTELPEGLAIGAVCKREDVRDVFIPHPANALRKLMDQPVGAKVATGSLRRKCQLLNLRRDFEVVDIRGNLGTRLRKLEESDWAGIVLAKAGVKRLGLEEKIGETIDVETILPAVGQGALCVEMRQGDERIRRIVSVLNHMPTYYAVLAERSLLRRLEGGCQVPVGTYARIESGREGISHLVMDAVVGALDGKTVVRGKTHGDLEEAEAIGTHLAETLLAGGADRILETIRGLPMPDVMSVEA
jgi:hydroxymethylbilane synthase